MTKPASLEVRFWMKVQKTDTCWLWTAALSNNGYGFINSGGEKGPILLAHRVSWSLFYGDIPEGLKVLHRCDNPTCVRPDHLFLGTQAENMSDMYRKGRAPIGERHHTKLRPETVRTGERSSTPKLTWGAVREIRTRYERGGVSQDALAVEYGVSRWCIVSVLRGRTWKEGA